MVRSAHHRARGLRRDSTDAEQKIWSVLKNRQLGGYKFYRQRPIGKYIVDFVCPRCRLIIEADGGQHADNAKDLGRTKWLEEQGWKVLRFWNTDILINIEGVLETILLKLNKPHPPHRSPR